MGLRKMRVRKMGARKRVATKALMLAYLESGNKGLDVALGDAPGHARQLFEGFIWLGVPLTSEHLWVGGAGQEGQGSR